MKPIKNTEVQTDQSSDMYGMYIILPTIKSIRRGNEEGKKMGAILWYSPPVRVLPKGVNAGFLFVIVAIQTVRGCSHLSNGKAIEM